MPSIESNDIPFEAYFGSGGVRSTDPDPCPEEDEEEPEDESDGESEDEEGAEPPPGSSGMSGLGPQADIDNTKAKTRVITIIFFIFASPLY